MISRPAIWGHGTRFTVAQVHLSGTRMGSLKSQGRTSYSSSIETIALNCLVFSKRQTNEQTNTRTSPLRKAPICTLCSRSLIFNKLINANYGKLPAYFYILFESLLQWVHCWLAIDDRTTMITFIVDVVHVVILVKTCTVTTVVHATCPPCCAAHIFKKLTLFTPTLPTR